MAQPRNRKVQIRFTEEEFNSISRKAEAVCMDFGSYLRILGMKSQIKFQDVKIEK
jgi:hypothetical protein